MIAAANRWAWALSAAALVAGGRARAAPARPIAPAAPARDRAGAALGHGANDEAAREAASCLSLSSEGELTADCGLILARARFQRGELAGAAETLAGLRGKLGGLEAHGEKLLGEALLLSGRAAQALEPLRAAAAQGSTSPASEAAAALLADALFDAGDFRGAAAQAERAAALEGQPSAVHAALAWTRVRSLAALALASQSGADARTAAQAARVFWRDFPDHPAAGDEPALEAQLAAFPGGALRPASPRDHVARAGHLLNAGQPALAVAEARAARESLSGEEREELDLLLARALAADGKRGEAGPLLEEAVRAEQPRTAAAAMLLLARDRSRRSDEPGAVALLDQLARRFPASSEADEGAFLAARLQLDAGQGDDGRKRLLTLAARRTANGAEARWALAWLSYRGNQPDAGERFAAAAALASDDESRARALYWQARTLAGPQASALYQRALALDPLGWYGLLAHAALEPLVPRSSRDAGAARPGSSEEAPPARADAPPFPPAAGASPLAAAGAQLPDPARRLLRIGFLPEAAAELDRAARAAHGDLPRLLEVLWGYEQAGRYDRSVPLAQSLLAGRPAPLEFRSPARAAAGAQDRSLRALLDAAYPAAFPSAVAASAQRAGLDPYLLLSIARRESVFKPDARSAAGAVGLLQLLPITARRAAAVLGRPAPSDVELLEPDLAIDLGAWYLSQLLERFGDPAVAVASYNAGPKAVAGWARDGAGKPLDAWVEEIPFKETRKYVKIVLGAWSAYRLLAGGEQPRLSLAVPEVKSGTSF